MTDPKSQGKRFSHVYLDRSKPDNDNRDLALAPGEYRKFREDGFFVVGQSDPRRDWPYVHPGPDDTWAGGRAHTFTIVFALRAAPAGGDCGLLFALADTHRGAPPVLDVNVNGRSFRQKLPAGAGDASIAGRGRPRSLQPETRPNTTIAATLATGLSIGRPPDS